MYTLAPAHRARDGQGGLVHNLPEGRSDCLTCGWSGEPARHGDGALVHTCPSCEVEGGDQYELIRRRRRREAAERATVRHTEPKVGRNEPCTCGSGRKAKRCCGAGS